MNKQPLLVCTICFASGIFIQDFFNFNQSVGLGLLYFGSILIGLGFIKTYFFDRIKSLFLLIFFICLGIFSHSIRTNIQDIPQIPPNKIQHIVFQLNKKLNSNEKNKRYEVEVLNLGQPFSAVIAIPKEQKELDFLHFYAAKTYLRQVEKPLHSFQFDYQKYLARQDIYFQGYTSQIYPSEKKNIDFKDKIKQSRLDLLNKIDASTLHHKNKALLKGIILADRTEIDQETLSTFSQTGLIHILAISGSHMAIIFLLILFFLKPFFSNRYRHIPIYISLLTIWAFAIFIDFGNSVVRSCIMITTYYLMVFMQRKPNLLHSMALAGLIILGWNSQELFHIGFQLSFSAVLGIFLFYQPIIKIFGRIKNHFLRMTLNTFALSLSAQLIVTPFVIYYFHQFSIMSVFINVISIIFSQAFIIFSFIICILFGLNIIHNWILEIYNISATFFLKMVAFFSEWDFSFIENISISILEIIILFISIYWLRKSIIKPNLHTFIGFSSFILIFILVRVCTNFYYWQKEEILVQQFYRETFVSIKQNDKATFLINNHTNIKKVNDYIIRPYIASRRINQIEIKSFPKGAKIRIKGKTYEIK